MIKRSINFENHLGSKRLEMASFWNCTSCWYLALFVCNKNVLWQGAKKNCVLESFKFLGVRLSCHGQVRKHEHGFGTIWPLHLSARCRSDVPSQFERDHGWRAARSCQKWCEKSWASMSGGNSHHWKWEVPKARGTWMLDKDRQYWLTLCLDINSGSSYFTWTRRTLNMSSFISGIWIQTCRVSTWER